MGSLTIRPANVAYSFATGAWTQTGDAPALSDSDDGTAIIWAQSSSSSGFFPPYVQGVMETTTVLQDAMAAGATNVEIVVHSRASGVGDESVDDFPPTLYPQLAGIVFDSHIIEPGNPGGAAYSGGGTDNVINERSSLVTAGEPVSDGTASSLGDALAAGTAAFHVEVDWSNDSTLTFAELWFVITWDSVEWPLRVVDAPQDVAYRVGPDFNPDGGLLRIVQPSTGRSWKQGTGGSAGSGSQLVSPDSFTVVEVEAGAWEDDGPDSLHDIDGAAVRWRGTIGGLDDQYVEAVFGPIVAAGTGPTSIIVSQAIDTAAGGGWTELYLADGTLIDTSFTTAGAALTADAGEIADILTNGAKVRRYGTSPSGGTSVAFDLDRVALNVFWDDLAAAPRPLRLVDPATGVLTVLPMIEET